MAGDSRAAERVSASEEPVTTVTQRASRLFALAAIVTAAGFGVGLLHHATEEARPETWTAGQVVEVELTLVSADVRNLACASSVVVAGRHCAFETAGRPWPAQNGGDGETLRPYTTTSRVSFLAAGLWSEAALRGRVPTAARFVARCKYTIEGKLPEPSVRWAPDGPWLDQKAQWNSGVVSDCAIVAAAAP